MSTLPRRAQKGNPSEQLSFREFETWKIYQLRHPITKETRYIGITRGSLEVRLNDHIKDTSRDKRRWVNELKKDDLLPEIALVADTGIFDKRKAEYIEARWIQIMLNQGHRLLNYKREVHERPRHQRKRQASNYRLTHQQLTKRKE